MDNLAVLIRFLGLLFCGGLVLVAVIMYSVMILAARLDDREGVR